MATGGSSDTQSILISSDEASTYKCTLCRANNITEKGIAFCTECREHLCDNCLKTHRRLEATRKHTIVQGSQIEDDTEAANDFRDKDSDTFRSSELDPHPDHHLPTGSEGQDRPSEVGSYPSRQVSSGLKVKKVGKVQKYKIKEKSDSKNPRITGLAFLEDNTLLICDNTNYTVKHLSVDMKIASKVSLAKGPCDVAVVGQGKAVVSIPWLEQLQYLTITPALQLAGTIELRRACWGVTTHRNNLYVTCTEPGEVLVVDETGRTVKSYGDNGEGTYKFERPYYVAVTEDGVMIVSDRVNSTITALNTEGDTMFQFMKFKYPRQVLVDSSHYVYVCDEYANIRIISPEGYIYRELVKAGKRRRNSSFSMALRRSDDTLVVGMSTNDKLLSYKFI